MASGIYDIVGGTDCDSSYNTESYQHGSKSSITWGIHEKVRGIIKCQISKVR